MDRLETATVIGWINPETGEKTRRTPTSLRQWRYVHEEFPHMPVLFAMPNIKTVEEACEYGHELLALNISFNQE